jgi:hypothetical protein
MHSITKEKNKLRKTKNYKYFLQGIVKKSTKYFNEKYSLLLNYSS